MTLFRNKYRIETTRLPAWDYAGAGWYFVTICTKDRIQSLGRVVDGDMNLSTAGEIVTDEWQRTGQRRSNLSLDEWVVMPNHIHGITVIKDVVEGDTKKTPQRGVSTMPSAHRWKPNSLGSIINQFKGACTKRIHQSGNIEFAWQPRFYDHVIRNERSLHDVREYIRNNPTKWDTDKYNPANLRT